MSKRRVSLRRRSLWVWQCFAAFVLAAFIFVIGMGLVSATHPLSVGAASVRTLSAAPELPAPQVHPLPPTLATWKDPSRSGDYFDQVQPVNVGYLIWSRFPITVYVESVQPTEAAAPFSARRAQVWRDAVLAAVEEWNRYLPLQVVPEATGADITIWRSAPPIQVEPGRSTQGSASSLALRRVRSAETRFDLYTQHPPATASATLPPAILSHRFTIRLRPDQASQYLRAAARHELGHALGIWGHSSQATDALYFSQVRNPPMISARDVNTLKRVYEQPTRLGWALAASPLSQSTSK